MIVYINLIIFIIWICFGIYLVMAGNDRRSFFSAFLLINNAVALLFGFCSFLPSCGEDAQASSFLVSMYGGLLFILLGFSSAPGGKRLDGVDRE